MSHDYDCLGPYRNGALVRSIPRAPDLRGESRASVGHPALHLPPGEMQEYRLHLTR